MNRYFTLLINKMDNFTAAWKELDSNKQGNHVLLPEQILDV